jgi:hypothetical protein
MLNSAVACYLGIFDEVRRKKHAVYTMLGIELPP